MTAWRKREIKMKENKEFKRWWDELSAPEQKMLGFNNALFVWQSAIESQESFHEGFAQGRAHTHRLQICGWELSDCSQPGMTWISASNGEGGEFKNHELALVIGKFYAEKF